MKVIIYGRPDGGVSICIPTGLIPIEEVLAKDVPPDAIDPQIVEQSEIPSDRTHRDCWVKNGNKVEVDSVKLQAKQDKIAAAAQEKVLADAAFAKLAAAAGLTDEEKAAYEKTRKGKP